MDNKQAPNTKIFPVLNEIVNLRLLKANKKYYSQENFSTIKFTNIHQLCADVAMFASPVVTSYTMTSNFDITEKLITGSLAASLGISAYLISTIKNSNYQETVKKVQNQLSKDFRIRFKTDTFEKLATGDVYAQAAVSSQILNSAPFIGVNKFTKAVNKWYQLGIKNNYNYIKLRFKNDKNKIEQIRKRFEESYNKSTYFFIDELYDYHSFYNQEKTIIKKANGQTIQTTQLDAYMASQLQTKGRKKSVLEELNKESIKRGYETSLIQDTQLAFVNTLKQYAQELISVNQNFDNLKKFKEQLQKFSTLYDKTNVEKGSDIPEYYSFKNVVNKIDAFKNISFLEDVANESYEKTVNRFNANLSDGKYLYLRTIKDNILMHRKLIMEEKPAKSAKKEYISSKNPIRKTSINYSSQFDDELFSKQLTESKKVGTDKPISYENKRIKKL